MKLFGIVFGKKKKENSDSPSGKEGSISFEESDNSHLEMGVEGKPSKIKKAKGSGGGILSFLMLIVGLAGGVFLTMTMPAMVEDITGMTIEGRHQVQAPVALQPQRKQTTTQPRRVSQEKSSSASVLPIDPSLADYKKDPFFSFPDFKKITTNFGPKEGEGLQVFLSFSCRYCSAGWQMTKNFVADNPEVPVTVHMIAGKEDVPYVAAYLLLAQKNRNLGNDFLDFVFGSNAIKGKYAEILMSFAQTKKFNPKEIFDYWDKNREELRLLLRENVELSTGYNIPGVPAFVAYGKFLNGEISLTTLTEAWKNPQTSPLLQSAEEPAEDLLQSPVPVPVPVPAPAPDQAQ